MKRLAAIAAIALLSTACGEMRPEKKASLRCIGQTRQSLKDPGSFRILDKDVLTTADGKRVRVLLRYSGTNSFGGRVKNHNVCIYNIAQLTNA